MSAEVGNYDNTMSCGGEFRELKRTLCCSLGYGEEDDDTRSEASSGVSSTEF